MSPITDSQLHLQVKTSPTPAEPHESCTPRLYRHQPPSLASSQYAWCCPPPMLMAQPCSTAKAAACQFHSSNYSQMTNSDGVK